jgi:hypothetical protein
MPPEVMTSGWMSSTARRWMISCSVGVRWASVERQLGVSWVSWVVGGQLWVS